MADGHHTIVVDVGGDARKLCRVFFGKDGSYYVTSPYHSERRARISKRVVTYGHGGLATSEVVGPEATLELVSLDDDDRALKLSHHPDGFIQFSGQGVRSGRNADGTPKGIGVMSWKLDTPVYGPALGITFRGLDILDRWDGKTSGNAQIFRLDDLTTAPVNDTFAFEMYYFPPHWRRFVRSDATGAATLSIVHPSRAVLDLRVLVPASDCERQGFLGGEVYALQLEERLEPASMFAMSTSTGRLRRNREGLMEGDGLYCVFPAIGELAPVPSLDYVLGTEPERMASRGEDGPEEAVPD